MPQQTVPGLRYNWLPSEEKYGRAIEALEDQISAAVRERDAALAAVEEAVELMRTARGHYGIEEVAGPQQPATDYDDLHDEMRAFVWRWGDGADG